MGVVMWSAGLLRGRHLADKRRTPRRKPSDLGSRAGVHKAGSGVARRPAGVFGGLGAKHRGAGRSVARGTVGPCRGCDYEINSRESTQRREFVSQL